MNESTKTKKALRGSLLALFLCIVLLIGTTFAWFTDTASTGVNKIQSGNLKVELLYSKDCQTWTKADSNTKLFDDSALFEPGHTQVVYVKVKNAGNLALKYNLAVNAESAARGKNVYNEWYSLTDYLMMGVADTDKAYDTREAAREAVAGNADVIKNGVQTTGADMPTLNPDEESAPVAMVLYMPETVGNEANPKSKTFSAKVDISVTLKATQATVENDSFGNDYDNDAATTVYNRIEYTSGTHEVTGTIQATGQYGAVHVKGGTTTVDANVYAVEAGNYAMAVYAENAGTKVIINGGDFRQQISGSRAQYDLIYADDGATIEINGGTFKAKTPQWTLNCQDGSSSKIIVKGGTFYKFDPSNAQTGEGEIVVPDGYKVVQNGDWYTVEKN